VESLRYLRRALPQNTVGWTPETGTLFGAFLKFCEFRVTTEKKKCNFRALLRIGFNAFVCEIIR